ncbi:hypothetical protein PM03_13000 [Thalassobacter stenotrophicus]|uniref:porin n=1 Tax=Thalassobacter stenotrophicus TaxID=266809 RepID=UPI00051FB969|nr:porin [Thalassobacter stenotrophicus]KGK78525.1 hypothetical protein PM03_13000 [Thalassobacter stenotrophicus]
MKKVLFATTAIVAFAGAASAAETTVSGFAELGINDNSSGDMQFFQDIEVTFGMSGETDGGLAFGASVQLDEPGAAAPGDDGGATAFISGSFGTLTMGDTDGALDWAMTETAVGGAIDDAHTVHAGYNGNGLEGGDGQVLRYDYSMGDFGFAVSLTQGDNGLGVVDDTTQVGVRYSMDMGGANVALGLGVADGQDAEATGFSAAVTAGAITGVVNYTDAELAGVDVTHTGLGLGYTAGALTVGVNWGEYDITGADNDDGFGIAVNYDLGGGAVVQLGYADSNSLDADDLPAGATNDDGLFSLGVAMSF